jgi:NADH-quinone oxidoreductase subunit A
MPELLQDYLPIVIFMGLCIGLGIALMASAFVIAIRRPDPEKMSAYECGFDAFDDARMKFDIRFYLVSILFIIFDLEVAFLFPVGHIAQGGRRVRLLVDDDFPWRADHWLRL